MKPGASGGQAMAAAVKDIPCGQVTSVEAALPIGMDIIVVPWGAGAHCNWPLDTPTTNSSAAQASSLIAPAGP